MTTVLEHIKKDNLLLRLLSLLVSSFVLTFIYNKFLVTNHIVVGGVSGLAIIAEEVFHISTTLFINVVNVFLVILSFIFLGKKKTIDQLIGCIVYITMLNITAPLAELIKFEFQSFILMIIIISIIYGICNGIIYKAGYSTGGTDFLAQILSVKLDKSITQISLVIQILIMAFSVFIFGLPLVMVSIFIIYVSNKITDAILFGISYNKMVLVVSSKDSQLEDAIIENMQVGTTILKARGGYQDEKKKAILCVVHNAQYVKFKSLVLHVDPEAFIISNVCYGVSGGTKYEVLPL